MAGDDKVKRFKKRDSYEILKICFQNASVPDSESSGLIKSVKEDDYDAIEKSLDIVLEEFSKNGLTIDSEPNKWGFELEDVISLLARKQQKLNDSET